MRKQHRGESAFRIILPMFSHMFLFSSIPELVAQSVLSEWVPHTAQCNPPSHRPFSRLRGKTKLHVTVCTANAAKNPFTMDTILEQKKLQIPKNFFSFSKYCRNAQKTPQKFINFCPQQT